mgnify:CR=1 FL=1
MERVETASTARKKIRPLQILKDSLLTSMTTNLYRCDTCSPAMSDSGGGLEAGGPDLPFHSYKLRRSIAGICSPDP